MQNAVGGFPNDIYKQDQELTKIKETFKFKVILFINQ